MASVFSWFGSLLLKIVNKCSLRNKYLGNINITQNKSDFFETCIVSYPH